MPEHYQAAHDQLVLHLVVARSGADRWTGHHERFELDSDHRMFTAAVEDDCWDSVMLLSTASTNQRPPYSAALSGMASRRWCVHRAPGVQSDCAREVIADLIADGRLNASAIDQDDPFGFVCADGAAASAGCCLSFLPPSAWLRRYLDGHRFAGPPGRQS